MALLFVAVGCSSGGCVGGGGTPLPANNTLSAFCGAASKPALDEAAQSFEKQTGIKVYLTYGGSGAVLSQMKISKSGDLYIPGTPDYIIKAGRDGLIDPSSVDAIAYLVPVIAVQHGNPKNIRSLSDLAKPGIKVGIGNPEAVCLGLYSIEILDYNHLLEPVSKNIITYAESCEKTATLVQLKAVDAVIGWHVFHDWSPDDIDVVYLEPEQIPRIAYIPAATSVYAQDKENAQKFIDFLVSTPSQNIFRKWGYFATEAEARKFAPHAQIGGEYELPDAYKELVK
jgi:molybdate transport system substrate-binding protein